MDAEMKKALAALNAAADIPLDELERRVRELRNEAAGRKNRTYQRVAEIIEALQEYRQGDKYETAHTNLFTDYLIEYFQKFDEEYKPNYPDLDDVGCHRGRLLLRAVTTFEESGEEWVKKYRDEYEKFWNRGPAYVGVYAERSSIEGALARYEFRKIMEGAMPEREADYTILDGVWSAIDVYFNKFIEKVYIEKGMHEAIRGAKVKGVGGIFGETKLLTYDIIGRIMFTFSRGGSEETMPTDTITFIKASDEKFALGAGVQSCHTDLITALTMIEDVIKNYKPEDFKEDREISMI